MYVVSATDPDNIILQPAESAKRLAKLMELIETKYTGQQVEDFRLFLALLSNQLHGHENKGEDIKNRLPFKMWMGENKFTIPQYLGNCNSMLVQLEKILIV